MTVVNRFGAYEILYELKTGGMGAVLLGRRRGPGAFEQLFRNLSVPAGERALPETGSVPFDVPAVMAEQERLARLGSRRDHVALGN